MYRKVISQLITPLSPNKPIRPIMPKKIGQPREKIGQFTLKSLLITLKKSAILNKKLANYARKNRPLAPKKNRVLAGSLEQVSLTDSACSSH